MTNAFHIGQKVVKTTLNWSRTRTPTTGPMNENKDRGVPGSEQPVALSAVSPSQEPREDAAAIANAPIHRT